MMAAVVAWLIPAAMVIVLGRLIWRAFTGKAPSLNRARRPIFFWAAIVIWGLPCIGFALIDINAATQWAIAMVGKH